MTGMTRDEILANPNAANAAIEAVSEAVASPLPAAPFPPDDLVSLPGGLVHDRKLIRSAVVRELNGEDEEALARAIQNPNPYHFIDTLLSSGVVRLGDLGPDESRKLLPSLLVGDRDEIILGIRRVTYGDDVEVFGWVCPVCQRRVEKISFSLTEDVERVKLKNPAADSAFSLKLRNGASAVLRLANGAVQTSVFETPGLLAPQRDDLMLTKCVETYTDRHGQTHLIAGFPSTVRQMAAPDRRKILLELANRQPGPRYNEIKFKHDECGDEVTLALGITDLFRELLTGLV